MFTPKQERNGADQAVATHNSAQPGPDESGAISGLVSAAQTDAGRWVAAGRDIFNGSASAGPDPTDWDSPLAVAEQPGEA